MYSQYPSLVDVSSCFWKRERERRERDVERRRESEEGRDGEKDGEGGMREERI